MGNFTVYHGLYLIIHCLWVTCVAFRELASLDIVDKINVKNIKRHISSSYISFSYRIGTNRYLKQYIFWCVCLQSVSWILAEFCYNRSHKDHIPALARFCKKQLTGFFVCLLFFLKVKHIS